MDAGHSVERVGPQVSRECAMKKLLILCLLALFAVSPALAGDADDMMGDINKADGTSAKGVDPKDLPKLNKDGFNKRLPEKITLLAEKYALRDALDTMRTLLKKVEVEVKDSCVGKSTGDDVLVYVDQKWWKGGNYWTVAPTLGKGLIENCERLYKKCDVGISLSKAVEKLTGRVETDWKNSERKQRVMALTSVRYKLLPKVQDELAKVRRKLYDIGALPTPYEILTTAQRDAAHKALKGLVAMNGYVVKNVQGSVENPDGDAVKRTLLNWNWRLHKVTRENIEKHVKVLEELDAKMVKEEGGSNLDLVTKHFRSKFLKGILFDWGTSSENKRMRALLEIRDVFVPEATKLLNAEMPVIERALNSATNAD